MATPRKNKATTPAPVRAPMNPENVPYIHDLYTFAERERELALLDTLLSGKLAGVREERAIIRHQIVTGDYGYDVDEDFGGIKGSAAPAPFPVPEPPVPPQSYERVDRVDVNA